MTWTAFRSRGEVLRAVVATADEHCDGVLPTQVPGVAENFENDLDLLSALLLRWHARLSGNVERTLAQQPLDLELAVARAWRRTADQMPGVRAVVDRQLAESADDEVVGMLRRATERERVRLAAAAGLANDASEAAARAGARLEQHARALPGAAPGQAIADEVAAGPGGTLSFVDRIRAVLAA